MMISSDLLKGGALSVVWLIEDRTSPNRIRSNKYELK